MEQQERQIGILNQMLLEEMPEYRAQARRFPPDGAGQRRLLRSLMNVRPPMPLNREFLAVQDGLLSAEREKKGVVDGAALPASGRAEPGEAPPGFLLPGQASSAAPSATTRSTYL